METIIHNDKEEQNKISHEEEKDEEEKDEEEKEKLNHNDIDDTTQSEKNCCNYHESVINYLKFSLDKSIPTNTFPVRCFTCDEILSHKWELYLLVRYYFVHEQKEKMEKKLGYPIRDEEFERTVKLSIRNLQNFIDGTEDIFDNPSHKAFQQLQITKECCKRMFKSMAE